MSAYLFSAFCTLGGIKGLISPLIWKALRLFILTLGTCDAVACRKAGLLTVLPLGLYFRQDF